MKTFNRHLVYNLAMKTFNRHLVYNLALHIASAQQTTSSATAFRAYIQLLMVIMAINGWRSPVCFRLVTTSLAAALTTCTGSTAATAAA
jgi:hypothetical protein